jgi:hypothetical protein
MADRAPRALRGIRQVQRLGDASRTGCDEDREGARVKVFAKPDEILAAFRAGAAMAARGLAALQADILRLLRAGRLDCHQENRE